MAENEGTNGNTEAASDLEKKIIKQIEFYFGDKNLPRDKFLRQKIDEDEGSMTGVTLECLATFNRLKSLSTDTDALAKAVRKSDAGLVEVSEDNKKVRRVRSKPIPENSVEARQDAKTRTVYCKGFPKELTLDHLEEFFADKGKVVYIYLRRDEEYVFKGSVFIEFASADEAKAFVALEALKYKEEEEELIKMMKDEYYIKKGIVKAQRKEEENKDKKKENEGDVKKEIKEEKKEEEEDKEEPQKYDNGCVLHFKDVGEQTSREDLKSLFEEEDIAWVDFNKGDIEGYVRFSKEGGAQRVIDAVKAKNDGKVVIREVETTLRVLEGDEENDYWKKVQEEREKARQRKSKKFRGGHSGGRGGGRFGGGRGRGKRRSSDRQQKKPGEENDGETQKRSHTRFDDGEPTVKKIKTEED